MIAVDTSALVAIAFGEEDAAMLVDRLTRQDSIVGAPSLCEAYLVVHNQMSMVPKTILADLLTIPTLRIVPFTQAHATRARRLSALRQRPGASGQVELRRLPRLCGGQARRPPPAFQGRRLRAHRPDSGRPMTSVRIIAAPAEAPAHSSEPAVHRCLERASSAGVVWRGVRHGSS